jgi:hypothetical protein
MSDEKKEPLNLFAAFAYDEAKAEKGRWFNYKHARLLIAAYANREFTNAHDLFNRKYPTKESREAEEAQIIYEGLIARHILLGWEGFDVPYSHDAAKQLLRSRIAREWVMSIAVDSSNFRPDEAAVLKN